VIKMRKRRCPKCGSTMSPFEEFCNVCGEFVGIASDEYFYGESVE